MSALQSQPGPTHAGSIARRWSMEWWVIPKCDTKAHVDSDSLLAPVSLPVGSPPIDWSFLNWREVTDFQFFRLAPGFREEVKAAIRKRSRIKGNIKYPFIVFDGAHVPFELYVVLFPDRFPCLYIRTLPPLTPTSFQQLVHLSSHPAVPESQVYMAIEKALAVLRSGHVRSRPSTKVGFKWYPYIHISDFASKVPNIPWEELVSLGTRHRAVSTSDVPLVSAFKQKNLSIRGGVLIVDKQATTVVAPQEYLELEGIRHCLTIALRMRALLEARFLKETETLQPNERELRRRLRLVVNRPSVITDSMNYRSVWPTIARECQVMEWLDPTEARSA